MQKQKIKRYPINGWINIDKPEGVGSTDVVRILKRALSPEKIGHAGTLDPLASGILPIALGEATKTVAYMMDAKKSYQFTIKWGKSTDTQDAEGQVTDTSDQRPDEMSIKAILSSFIGTVWQTPPQYSAIKVNGQRAYDLAREGEVVELKQRLVTIQDLRIIKHTLEYTEFFVACGKGMYVRSLARDIAEKLGCCGYVTGLRREKVGGFTLDSAISLDKFALVCDLPAQETYLKPVTAALDDIPVLVVTETEAALLRRGSAIIMVSKPNLERLHTAMASNAGYQGALNCVLGNKQPVAIASVQGVDVRPMRVFNL